MAQRQDSDREVLTSLPRTRPVRRSAKRGDRADAKSSATATPRRGADTKPAAAKTTAAKKPSTRSAKTTAAKKPPARAAKTAPGANAKATPNAPKRKVPPAGYASPSSRADAPVASGTAELIGTTLQAAAELAQIGLTVGRQTLQSMFDRLPKP